MRTVFTYVIIFRILLFIPLLAAFFFLPYRDGYEYTNIWKFTKPYTPVSHFLLYPWANFDGVHYLSIASDGYRDNERFFPLYPLLIRALSFFDSPFGPVQFFVAFFLSNVSFLLALFVFYKLLRLDYSDHIAKRTILFLLVFPTSFFFASLYAESLFLLLLLLCFSLAREKRWLLASLCGMLLSATRIVGILILPALAYELIKNEKRRLRGLWLLLTPLGLIAYTIYNAWAFGNPLQFLANQQEVANSRTLLVFPVQTLVRYGKILSTVPTNQFEWWIALLEVTTFVFVGYLLYAAWRRGVRFSYVVFTAFSFLIPVFSGTFSGLPRYVAVLFPIFITLAITKNKVPKFFYAAISIVLLFLLLLFFSKGYYVA